MPARITDPDDASRAALQVAVSAAMQNDVLLADNALTDSDVLVIGRGMPATPEGRLATGRNMDTPVQFRLELAAGKCVLIDSRDSTRHVLQDTRCIAL
jgi:hypothetical protein